MSYWHIHRFSSFALSFSVFAPYNRYIKIVVGVVLVSGLSGTLCPVTCTHFLLPTFQRFSFGGKIPTFFHQHLTKSSSSFFSLLFTLFSTALFWGNFLVPTIATSPAELGPSTQHLAPPFPLTWMGRKKGEKVREK